MTDRLTDEELARAVSLADEVGFGQVRAMVAELRDRREKELIHSQNHCLDCEGPLVQCDCQPDCPGGMCARACHRTRPAEPQGLTQEEWVDLNWLSGFLGALLEREAVSGSQMERAVRVVRKVVASHLLAAEVRR